MNSPIDILACPFCKLGMDELQARAMEVSIYILLFLIYSLIGIIVYKIARMMAREERALASRTPAELPGEAAGEPAALPAVKDGSNLPSSGFEALR